MNKEDLYLWNDCFSTHCSQRRKKNCVLIAHIEHVDYLLSIIKNQRFGSVSHPCLFYFGSFIFFLFYPTPIAQIHDQFAENG